MLVRAMWNVSGLGHKRLTSDESGLRGPSLVVSGRRLSSELHPRTSLWHYPFHQGYFDTDEGPTQWNHVICFVVRTWGTFCCCKEDGRKLSNPHRNMRFTQFGLVSDSNFGGCGPMSIDKSSQNYLLG